MRHVRMSFVLALVMLASVGFAGARETKAAPAAAIPGGPFATAFRVQNLDPTQNAQCSYELFDDAGQSRFTSPALPAIRPNESAFVYTPQVANLPAGTFGAVITCNVQVAAVVNYSDQTKGDTYVGIGNPSPTVYIPSAYNNYFNFFTQYRVMNASSTAQTVRLEYFQAGGAKVAEETFQLAANGVRTIEQNARPELQRNTPYSAKLTGSAPLAATVSIYGQGVAERQLYSFSGFAEGTANAIFAPVIMNNYYGYDSAITIQNLDAAEADVDVQYTNGVTRNVKVAGNSSQVVLNFQETTLQRNVLYSARIVSKNGRRLIVTVNESLRNNSRASTYEGMPTGGRRHVAPITMFQYFGFNSSITCQNIGGAATRVDITYAGTNRAGQPVTVTGDPITIAPGATGFFFQFLANQKLPTGFIGSATLTAASSDIVCVVNQDQSEPQFATQNVDQLYAYGTLRP